MAYLNSSYFAANPFINFIFSFITVKFNSDFVVFKSNRTKFASVQITKAVFATVVEVSSNILSGVNSGDFMKNKFETCYEGGKLMIDGDKNEIRINFASFEKADTITLSKSDFLNLVSKVK